MSDLQLIVDFFFNIMSGIANLYFVSFVLSIPIVYFLLDNLVYLFKKVQGKR